jgi:hypothetical protein
MSAAIKTKRKQREALGPYGGVGKALGELDDRLGIAKGGRTFMDKIFPDHWSFMLGEIALYSFVIVLATGVFLTLYYVPMPARDYLPRQLRAAATACEHSAALRLIGRLRVSPFAADCRCARCTTAACDIFVWRHRRAHAAHLLHRRLPQAARAQLDDWS